MVGCARHSLNPSRRDKSRFGTILVRRGLRLTPETLVVKWNEIVVAATTGAMRVLETASPPTFYLPPEDVRLELLSGSPSASVCEWKGPASYWSLAFPEGPVLPNVGWTYREPFQGFDQIVDYISFYPARLACFIAGVRVEPQPGNVYGGWVTPDVVGPFKGEPGTEGW